MYYLILQHPGHNRVYFNSADKLALAELKLASRRLSSYPKEEPNVVRIEDIRYLAIETQVELIESDLEIISRLSFVFALFKSKKLEDISCLIPLKKKPYLSLEEKISSILKYQGKTNELFTKMMINVALLSSDFGYSDSIKLLDPIAGKGTTLFEGAVSGFDVYGIEIEPKSVHESIIFFKKFLEEERFKHISGKRQIYGTTKAEAIWISEFEYAKTKELFKSKTPNKKLGMICGKSQDAFKYFKKKHFNLLVGDLPYGVFHGNTTGKINEARTRDPSRLLNKSIEDWYQVLKFGGVAVIAFNAFVASKDKISKIFTQKGFKIMTDIPFTEFEHRVDQSIKRDIIVAKKENNN